MKKYIFTILALLLLVVTLSGVYATASTMIRTPSANVVAPGQTFTVTYTTQNVPNSKYFVAWEDSISGGCSPSSYKQFIASESGGVEQITKTFTAPQSGSCTFTGHYQYADGTDTAFTSQTVAINATGSGNGTGSGDGDNTLLYLGIGAVVLIIVVIALKR